MSALIRYLKRRPVATGLALLVLLAGGILAGVEISSLRHRGQQDSPEATALAALATAGQIQSQLQSQMQAMQVPPSLDPNAAAAMQQYQLAMQAAMGQGATPGDVPMPGVATGPDDESLPIVVKGAALARAFDSGQLPAPLPVPQGTTEQVAAELTRRIIADDEQSTAALLTAVQMAGISVRGDDGALAYAAVKPGQGILMDAWEVAGLAKLYGEDMQISLADLSRTLSSLLTPRQQVPFESLLVDGIRAAAQSGQPARRFWAEFIAELGRQSSAPYDLLAPHVDAGKVNLDAIQVSLILRRLATDVLVANSGRSRRTQWMPAPGSGWSIARAMPALYQPATRLRPRAGNTAWRFDRRARLVPVAEGGGSTLPCTLSEWAEKLTDIDAYANALTFDKILDHLVEHGSESAEGFKNGTRDANIVLYLIKLYAYFASLQTDVTMSGSPPLKRTQSPYADGELRRLTATVRENIGKWQTLNCTRILFNGANLDFSLPKDGPVVGVKTQWQLREGGRSVHNNQITHPIVELRFLDGTPLIQTEMGPISNAAAPVTDEQGHTYINLEGVRQPQALRAPIEVMKRAAVSFSVAPKASSMNQDLIDAVGLGAGAATGDDPIGLGMLAGAVVETALRSNLHMSKTLYIPVRDWRSCEGGWKGSVSYGSTNEYVQKDADTVSTMVNTSKEVEYATLDVEADPPGSASWSWSGVGEGTYTAGYQEMANMVKFYRPVKDSGSTTFTTVTNIVASGKGDADIEITSAGKDLYQIKMRLNGGPLHGTFRTHKACTGDCRGYDPKHDPDANEPFDYGITGLSVVAKADPALPEKLAGNTTLKDTPAVGWKTDIKWDLTQCLGEQ